MKRFERQTEYRKCADGTLAIVYDYNMDTVRKWEADGWKLRSTYYEFLSFWKFDED